MIEKVCLEVEPVWRYIATEGTLATVAGCMAAAMHVEQSTVTKHRTACAHKHCLSLTQIGQDLLIREVRQ